MVPPKSAIKKCRFSELLGLCNALNLIFQNCILGPILHLVQSSSCAIQGFASLRLMPLSFFQCPCYLNSKFICTHLTTHGRVAFKMRCCSANFWGRRNDCSTEQQKPGAMFHCYQVLHLLWLQLKWSFCNVLGKFSIYSKNCSNL